MKPSELIVMLTYNDCTVENAAEIFEACVGAPARYWGFKEKPLPLEQMQALYARIRGAGKTTVLEVVEYEEDACLAGARMAVACECDILMGTTYHDSVLELCAENDIKYMPFIGVVSQRPSVLEGTAELMLEQLESYARKGVYGVDLLGYRHIGDAEKVMAEVLAQSPLPVCLAGSVDSYQKLDFIKANKPWAFTIGSAFFDGKFGGSFSEQIAAVGNHLHGSRG
ncbi:hypothetical protein [Rothia nasisuis]|uniref:hypothetical protein n=1 Tax=Rothia nasisuis TaxID=2109647 RepID=UPI001F28CF68|nr:hypothetical protein [Rothia nasisuis]